MCPSRMYQGSHGWQILFSEAWEVGVSLHSIFYIILVMCSILQGSFKGSSGAAPWIHTIALYSFITQDTNSKGSGNQSESSSRSSKGRQLPKGDCTLVKAWYSVWTYQLSQIQTQKEVWQGSHIEVMDQRSIRNLCLEGNCLDMCTSRSTSCMLKQ